MCAIKSMIILKDRVYCPADTDSHSDMLEQLGIKDESLKPNFVKVEITPPNSNFFRPLNEWVYKVDQDHIPKWYIEEIDKERAFKALKEWADGHIFIGKNNFKITGDGWFCLKDCNNVEAYGNATVRAYDNATVEAYGNATVRAYNNATVRAYNNATVEAYDNATVRVCDNVTVRAYHNATVRAYNNATVEACDNATVEACHNATVMAYGNATVRAYNNATVEAYDNATVEAYDNATVEAYDNATGIIPNYFGSDRDNFILTDNSTLKDCKTNTIYQAGNWKFVAI
jgi:hypothetical protein